MADQEKRSSSFPKIHLEDDPHITSSDNETTAPPSPAQPLHNPTESLYDDPYGQRQIHHQPSRLEAEALIRRHLYNTLSPPPSSPLHTPYIAHQATRPSISPIQPASSTSLPQNPEQAHLTTDDHGRHHRQQEHDLETGVSTRRGSIDSIISIPPENELGERRNTRSPQPGVLTHLLRLYHVDNNASRRSIQDDEATLRGSRPPSRTVARGRSSGGGKKGSKKDSGSGSNTDNETDVVKQYVFGTPRWYSQASMASRASLNMEAMMEKGVSGASTPKDSSPGGGGGAGGQTPTAASASTEDLQGRGGKEEKVKKKGVKEKIKRGISRVKRSVQEHRRLKKIEEQTKITVHIAETLQRQKYILRLCRALMVAGAPSHRLEEYLTTTAHVLSVSCSFVYLPSCMVISFNDATTHTSDVQLVRAPTALDLGKLQYLHIIYKEVLHDVIGVEEGNERLEEILKKPPVRNKWYRLILYSGASAAIGPLFDARVHDLPLCFALGAMVAFMALVINPKSESFQNIFEIFASLLVSFFARAMGSLRKDGKEIFCFSGITQGAIAPLLLPGYIILIGAMELQSKKLVAGAVRMFYAVIYSVLLWFGISIGTALYGAMDPNATVSTKCTDTNLHEYRFFYAPLYAVLVALANQAQWIQIPAMLVISTASYTVTFFSLKRFPHTVHIANTLASLTVGILGNLYSRVMHQAAFTVMVPAILLQVQSGISSAGSLTSGLKVAQSIVEGGKKVVAEGAVGEATQMFIESGGMGELAYGLIAVAVGISFGLFLSTVVVYPFGKRRSGFFSF